MQGQGIRAVLEDCSADLRDLSPAWTFFSVRKQGPRRRRRASSIASSKMGKLSGMWKQVSEVFTFTQL